MSWAVGKNSNFWHINAKVYYYNFWLLKTIIFFFPLGKRWEKKRETFQNDNIKSDIFLHWEINWD